MSTVTITVQNVSDEKLIATIKGLAPGGVLVDTGVPVAPKPEPQPAAEPLPDDTSYVVEQANGGSNSATGDQDLATKVAMALTPIEEGGAGGLVSVSALTAGEPIPVDYRAQLRGKSVSLALLTPNVSDLDAAAAAMLRANDWFGARSFSVSAVNWNGGVGPDARGRIVHCSFICT